MYNSNMPALDFLESGQDRNIAALISSVQVPDTKNIFALIYQIALIISNLCEDIPIVAIVVANNKILGYGYNLVEKIKQVHAHAEIIAINMACKSLKTKVLQNAILYVNISPCMMCIGTAIEAQIKAIKFPAINKNKLNLAALQLFSEGKNHLVGYYQLSKNDNHSKLISNFFVKLRTKKANERSKQQNSL